MPQDVALWRRGAQLLQKPSLGSRRCLAGITWLGQEALQRAQAFCPLSREWTMTLKGYRGSYSIVSPCSWSAVMTLGEMLLSLKKKKN